MDCADNLVSAAIVMHLADVVQRGMGLVTVAWAQLEEQCIADRWIGESQNLPLEVWILFLEGQDDIVGASSRRNYVVMRMVLVYFTLSWCRE